MKFVDAEDDIENLMLFRKVSEDGTIDIAIHPVIFGFRVVAGYVGAGEWKLNYCAGNHVLLVELIYAMVLATLEKHDGNFDVFPFQKTKPMFNDPACFIRLCELSGDTNYKVTRFPNLHARKIEILKDRYKQ